MKRQTGTFVAHHADKRPETLYVYREFKHVGTHDDPNAEIPTFKEIRTSRGQVCRWKKKGVYEILDTGEILTSDHSDAP